MDITHLDEEEALELLRDKNRNMVYLMMKDMEKQQEKKH